MKFFLASVVALASVVSAQNDTNTNDLHLPAGNPCAPGSMPGSDTVIFTSPYTYDQVLSIIGSFQNITWSGSPFNTVTLNGTDNTVGTARTYDIDGAHVIETITVYSKPSYPGPYDEVHTLYNLSLPTLDLWFYGDYDGTTVVPTCGGAASIFNFTINFCSNNATAAAATLHSIHMGDAQTVNTFLGGQNFSSCSAIMYGAGGSNFTGMNATGTTTSPSGTTTSTPVAFTGGASLVTAGSWVAGVGAVVLAGLL